jgi:DNA-binding response OmpR family regulator
MSKRVLVIEDERPIVKLLEFNLRREGYSTLTAADGEAGLKSFKENNPDLVILDLNLPKMDGIEVCRAIREHSKVPILILSARKEEIDRVLGLEIGADDYMTKPFSIRELLARLKAILRRPGNLEMVPAADPDTAVVGNITISFRAFEVRIKDVPVPLTTKEFDLLCILYKDNKKTFSRDELLDLVWGVGKSGNLDTRTVDQHVARLRKKLGSEGARLVTVKNRGYRFRTS